MRKILYIMMSILLFAGVTLSAAGSKEDTVDYTKQDQLFELIQNQSEPHLLLDVRTVSEYNQGHIPTAVNLSVTDIDRMPPAVAKDSLIIVYCRSGNRSATAKKILESLGYTQVVDFGGINRWDFELET